MMTMTFGCPKPSPKRNAFHEQFPPETILSFVPGAQRFGICDLSTRLGRSHQCLTKPYRHPVANFQSYQTWGSVWKESLKAIKVRRLMSRESYPTLPHANVPMAIMLNPRAVPHAIPCCSSSIVWHTHWWCRSNTCGCVWSLYIDYNSSIRGIPVLPRV